MFTENSDPIKDLNISYKFNYPEDFEDFSTGVNVNNKEINEWIQDNIKDIREQIYNGQRNPHHITLCGNTALIIVAYKQPNEKYIFDIIVAKNYKGFFNIDMEL